MLLTRLCLLAALLWAGNAFASDVMTFGGKSWSLEDFRAKYQEKIDADPRIKKYSIDMKWVAADCSTLPFADQRPGDKCLKGPILPGTQQCHVQTLALFRSDANVEMVLNYLVFAVSDGRCGMPAGNARTDEKNIKDLVEIVETPQKYESVKIVKNAHTMQFTVRDKNCVGIRDYGTPISAPGNSVQLYSFSTLGYICDQTGKGFDKAAIEQLLTAYRPKGY